MIVGIKLPVRSNFHTRRQSDKQKVDSISNFMATMKFFLLVVLTFVSIGCISISVNQFYKYVDISF